MTRTPHTQKPLRQGRISLEKEDSAVGEKRPKGYMNVPFFFSCHYLSCFVASLDLVVASVTTSNSLHQTPSQLTLGGHHSSHNVCLFRSSETEINPSVNDGTWGIWLDLQSCIRIRDLAHITRIMANPSEVAPLLGNGTTNGRHHHARGHGAEPAVERAPLNSPLLRPDALRRPSQRHLNHQHDPHHHEEHSSNGDTIRDITSKWPIFFLSS